MRSWKSFTVTLCMLFVLIFALFVLPNKINNADLTKVAKIERVLKKSNIAIGILGAMGEKKYVVSKGDSIIRIAGKFYILPWQLRNTNNLQTKDIIHPGDILTIPNIKWPTYSGVASWYGGFFHGRPMANGKIYNKHKLLVAHRTLPLNIPVRLTDEATGKTIVVKVEDRGPYTKDHTGKYSREFDLSFGLARFFGSVDKGLTVLKIEPLGMTL